MLSFAHGAAKIVLALILASGIVLALVWPWRAPAVDWRTPLDVALHGGDCDRAVKILVAATDAGSVEAFDFLIKPPRPSNCLNDPRLPENAARQAQALRFQRQIGEPPLLSEDNDTDTWLAYYVGTVDFLCRQPYQSDGAVDNVLLSKALEDDAGWILALHRQRRGICVGLLEQLTLALAGRSDRSAKELAYNLAMSDPTLDTPTSAIAMASLLLEQQFVPALLARGDAEQLMWARRMSWSKLRNAAEAGHARAISFIIALLHDRRIPDDAYFIVSTPAEDAYFWILRSRRLEQTQTALYTTIEASLGVNARKKIDNREQYDWELQQSLTPKERSR